MTIQEASNKLQELFLKRAEKISKAKEVLFERRKSKLTGSSFVKMFVFGFMDDTTSSIESLRRMLKDECCITKQGLNSRITDRAVLLMQRMFTLSLTMFKSSYREELKIFKPFNSVKLIDSSTISLPDSMECDYKGCGGSGSKAGLKLQVMFDYLKKQIDIAEERPGNQNDQSYKNYIDTLSSCDLVLQDRGYFAVSTFESIAKKGAFFISRFLTSTAIYNEEKARIDLLDLLSNSKSDLIDKNVLLGKKAKVSVRIVAQRLVNEKADERKRKEKKRARKKGRTLSQTHLKLLDWAIYITNVPVEMLSTCQVMLVYKTRWDIELLFKLFKSEADIDSIRGKLKPRIMCEIYAKMIGVVIFQRLTAVFLQKNNCELSPTKAIKIFKSQATRLMKALSSTYLANKIIKEIHHEWLLFATKDLKRKNRISMRNMLINNIF